MPQDKVTVNGIYSQGPIVHPLVLPFFLPSMAFLHPLFVVTGSQSFSPLPFSRFPLIDCMGISMCCCFLHK